MFLARQQVNHRNGQHDHKQHHRRRGGIGRIAACVAVEHIVHITYDGVHPGGIEIRAEQRHRVGIRLKCADKAGDDQIKQGGGDHGQGDPGEDPEGPPPVMAGFLYYKTVNSSVNSSHEKT